MLDLTFAEFYAAEYDDSHDVGVYVVKSDIPLYVGMSTSNIWNRWFYGTFRSHLDEDTGGHWIGNSPVGRAIVRDFPQSLDWRIELWRIEDCATFFNRPIERLDIRSCEHLLMIHYRPKLNVQF